MISNIWNDCPICGNELVYKNRIECLTSTYSGLQHYICVVSNNKIVKEIFWFFPLKDNQSIYEFGIERTFKETIISKWTIYNKETLKFAPGLDIKRFINSKQNLNKLFVLK